MSKQKRDLNRTERARELQAQQARAERNRKLAVVGAVVLAIALVAVALVWSQRGSNDPVAVDKSIPTSVGENSLKVGPDSAKHKVVVYEDFLCPYCREFEQGARKVLHGAAKKGTVQTEYRPFQLLQDDYSKHALAAFAYVLQKSGSGPALALHDQLYDDQPYETGPKPDANKIAGWASKYGVSKNAARTAIDSGETKWAEAAKAAADAAGVKGTPTILVDGKPLQGQSITEMIKNLEKLTAQ